MAKIDDALLQDIKHKKDFFQVDGDLALVKGLENLKQALLRRLVTHPGRLIHRPEYGVGIKDFQNAPLTLKTKETVAQRIGDNFIRDPRVNEVLGVSVESKDQTPEKVIITVRTQIVGYQDEVDFSFTPFSAGV